MLRCLPIYGPGQNNFDITLMKKFPLWSDKRSVQFRAEFYNAFNHTQYDAVDTWRRLRRHPASRSMATFGQVIATRSPRVIQFSLRLEF